MSSRRSKRTAPRDDAESTEGFSNYPEEFPVALSHTLFPSSEWVQERLDYPLGLTCRPFIPMNEFRTNAYNNVTKSIKDISRCSECGAYLNPHCEFNSTRWFCSLCGRRNGHHRPTRYKHIDQKFLPELNEPVMDFDAPFSDAIPQSSLPIEERPLIHLFLISEDMEMDTLEAVIESLSTSVRVCHPDLHFGILTFSAHRVGLYCFYPDSLIPTVQYVSLGTAAHEDPAYDHDTAASISTSTKNTAPEEDFALEDPALASVVDFADFVQPFRNASISMPSLLGSIIDLLPEGSDATTAAASTASASSPSHGPLYTTLRMVMQWLLSSRFTFLPSAVVQDREKAAQSNASTTNLSTLFSLLLSGGSPEVLAEGIETSYTGVMLHVFYDKYETAMVDGRHGVTVDQHLEILRQQANELSVVLNFWSVCSYDTQESLGHVWKPLIQATGGDFRRFSLRINPQDEKWRLQEALRRYFAKHVATKCLFRWRGTPMLYVIPGSMAGCVGTSMQEGDTFQANCLDGDSSVSMRLAMEDARRVEGWNSLDQKIPASSSGRHSFARGHAAGGSAAAREDKLADAVVMQLVFSYETIESFPSPVTTSDDGHPSSNSTAATATATAGTAQEDGDSVDPWAFFREGMDIWGHEWRSAFEQLLFPDRLGQGENHDVDDDLSEEDHEKVMILRKLFATYNATLEAKRNPAQRRNRFKNFQLRRDRSYPVDHVLVVRKRVRVITLCMECTNNIGKLRESCNLSVAMSLMLREALHHVGGGGGANGNGAATTTGSGVAPSSQRGGGGVDAVDQLVQRLHRNVGGEKDLFNAMMSVLHRAATLKEIELRAIYQKRNGGGHYTVDIASLHRYLMVDEPYTRDVIHTLYRALARILAAIESDPLTIGSREQPPLPSSSSSTSSVGHHVWSAPRVHDEMIDWMFLVLRAAPPVAVQLLIPNLRGIHIHTATTGAAAAASSSSTPLTPPPTTTSPASMEDTLEQPTTPLQPSSHSNGNGSGKAVFGAGKMVQFDDTGLLPTSDVAVKNDIPPPSIATVAMTTTTVPTTTSTEDTTEPSPRPANTTSGTATATAAATANVNRILMTTEALPLRRDAMMSASSELFLLDAGSEIILYQPMTYRQQRTKQQQQQEQQPSSSLTAAEIDGVYKSVFPFLSFRLLDHPLLPRLILAEAGEHSSHAFTSHMLEDHSSEANAMSFAECKQLTLRILEAIDFNGK